mmetsp:Transcript_38263/g.56352  ORF Transcript_38263/g.56352 Transcript_38263/m.56352 type:complete len:107 (+) Transcript_38263:106-426(+)
MRIGKSSKTDCIFFPSPTFFKRRPLASKHNNAKNVIAQRVIPDFQQQTTTRTGTIYNKLRITKLIEVLDVFVTFVKHFKYLGSYISYTLRDDHNIKCRPGAKNSAM